MDSPFTYRQECPGRIFDLELLVYYTDNKLDRSTFTKASATMQFLQKKDESGFTLVEIMVVILILGILLTIAIPLFLNQRKEAVKASVKSDVSNAAIREEQNKALAGTGVYWAGSGAPSGIMLSANNTMKVTLRTVNGKSVPCIQASNSKYPTETQYFYDFGAPAMNRTTQQGVCPL